MELEDCLRRNLIKEANISKDIIEKELHVAQEFIVEAEKTYNAQIFRPTLAASYYSMFHAARSLLYKLGYRERSPACLIASPLELVKDEDIRIGLTIMNEFRKLREGAQYNGNEISESEAKIALDEAKSFILLVGNENISFKP